IEEEPNNPKYFSERGVCFLNLNQFGRALEDMNSSVKLEPNYSYRYASRAFVKDKMGDTEGGIADYEIAVKLDPEDAIALNNLGLLQEKLGYKKSSERNFKKADDLAENNPNSLPNIEKDTNKVTEIKNSPLPPIQSNENESIGLVFKKIFTDSSTRKEFFKFLKNGFKVK
ncbi:MAG: tetratricopeptide repeat protein, partial [Flavobacteriales bacterium]